MRTLRVPAILSGALLSVVWLSCGGTQRDDVTPQQESSFVDAFLESQLEQAVRDDRTLIIAPPIELATLFDDGLEAFGETFPRDSGEYDAALIEAVKHFCDRNSGDAESLRSPTLSVSHVSLSYSRVREVFDGTGDDYDQFYEQYPEARGVGLIELSRPGFSLDGTTAVIYMGTWKHFLWGKGQIYVYSKSNGVWRQDPVGIAKWVS